MNFWKDKKVLVTGGQGFVGKAVIKSLIKRGCGSIIAPDKNRYNLTKESFVSRLFKLSMPDVVIHLAGTVGGIGVNKAFPGKFFYDNIMMGTLVMEYARRHNVQKVVALAAGCGYPDHLTPPYKESDFFSGLPDMNSVGYSMAKKNLVIQSITYREQYGLDSSVLLPANLYGPGDNFDLETSHVVPALVRKFVEAIVSMAEHGKNSGPFNLGTGKSTTIKELVSTINDVVGFEGDIEWDSSKPDGQLERYYDMSELQKEIGYLPATSLSQGVKETIEYFKKEWVEEPNKRWEAYSQ